MASLQVIDSTLFRLVNQSMANRTLDWLIMNLGGNRLFVPFVLLLWVLLLWKGGRRGRLCVLFLVLAIAATDGVVCNTVRKALGRPGPCVALPDARCLFGAIDAVSMPSSDVANWFAATLVCFNFYRRSWLVLLPAAALVAFAQVYAGAHFPADVIVGALLGTGCAGAILWSSEYIWRSLGQRFFPLWWQKLPSLLLVESLGRGESERGGSTVIEGSELDQHWLRLGYVLTVGLLLFRLGYIASGVIELSNDEAYQWLWSKHLALSYFSKPPAIAFIQFASTSIWGDTHLGVRFFSPVFAATLSVAMLRFLARELGARQASLALLIITSVPLMGVGTILMTIDAPLVLCWTLAMFSGWRAVQPRGTVTQWLLTGLAAGLGFLSKYSAAYLLVCWTLFFILWRPARAHLRRPGPYLALLIFALCTLPVVMWNAGHHWITVQHVAENAGISSRWRPTSRFFWEFLLTEAGLLNPVFFVGAIWAMAAFWTHWRERPLELYFFCMGGAVFLGHCGWSLRSRVMPNWIAPAVVPMFCLMVSYWDERWRKGARWVKRWLSGGLVLGLAAVAVMHNTDLIGVLAGRPLPGDVDPLRRVRGYAETAAYVERARENLAQEGKPVFILCGHYGITGLFTFYLPAARAALQNLPLVYERSSPEPGDQLYFWPEYRYADQRKGQNAIYVVEPGACRLEPAWPWKWLMGQEIGFAEVPPAVTTPPVLAREFESTKDLGIHEVKIGGRVFKRVQLFECRNLR
jgi:membrane-associated phospholipid phosphatase